MYASSRPAAAPAAVVAAAAVVLAVALGARSAYGLLVGPINTTTGFGPATVSLAFAASALAWGVAQPLTAPAARLVGIPRLLVGGALAVAALTALVPLAASGTALVATLTAAGFAAAAAGSTPLLLGVVTQRVGAARRGLALGIVSAGGSVGQLAGAPLVALGIGAFGWQGAMFAMAAALVAVVPFARLFRAPPGGAESVDADTRPALPLRQALRRRDYRLLTAGFFVCGFHVSFLTTHMPGVIELCGLPPSYAGQWLAIVGACNVVASLGAGHLMQRCPLPALLAALYALRALGVMLFLTVPPSATVLTAFALWMGLTYMATLPPTTGLVAQRFGTRSFAALFGFMTLVHQAGSFLGAWLGGVALERSGDYTAIWVVDVALAVAAAAAHLPLLAGARGVQAPASSTGTPSPSGTRAGNGHAARVSSFSTSSP